MLDVDKLTERELELLRRRLLAVVPLDGVPGEVLTKASVNNRDCEWSSGAGMLLYMYENFS